MEKWREQLIIDNMRLIGYVLKHYGHYKDEAERGVATEELVRSASKFDPNRGIKFNTYAVKNMMLKIRLYNASKRWLIAGRVKGERRHKDVCSLDQPAIRNQDDEQLTIGELIEDEDINEDAIICSADFALFLSKLSELERKILSMRANDFTQCEIGKALDITQVQVSRILKRLKQKYKEA